MLYVYLFFLSSVSLSIFFVFLQYRDLCVIRTIAPVFFICKFLFEIKEDHVLKEML